jgi:hypothetical protein
MNSMSNGPRLLAAALCAVALAGCDSVQDVRSEPSTALPKQNIVLEGKVYGLGIRRTVSVEAAIQSTSNTGTLTRVVQGFPGEAIGARGRESVFSFGALEDGTTYSLSVPQDLWPYGKLCTVNNGSGTLRFDPAAPNKGAPQNIEVVCTNDPAVARHDIRVDVPEPFRSAAGARVRLMTEEGVYEADPKDAADGDPNYVWFRDALIVLPAAGVLPFQNIVTATTEEDSTATIRRVNRCNVSNHTWSSPLGTGSDVTNVAVGACRFTVGGSMAGGSVRYSRPVGITTDPPMGAGGLVLELLYPDGQPIPSTNGPRTEVAISSFGGNFVFPTQVTSGAPCPIAAEGESPRPCEVRGFYEVAIRQQPQGQRCMVGSSTGGLLGPLLPANPTVATSTNFDAHINWGSSANLYIVDESIGTGTFPATPSNFQRLRVHCRNLPAPGRVLTGTYQANLITLYAGANVSSQWPWSPAYAARREFSHMLTLFDDGTFLFGAHTVNDTPNTSQVTNHTEYGFYDYDPANVGGGRVAGPKLRFTIHVDGSPGTAAGPLPAGLSGAEGPTYIGLAVTGTTGCTIANPPANDQAVRHHVMTNVVLGTVPGTSRRTLSGRFGPDGGSSAFPPPSTRCTVTGSRVIDFVEPESIPGQMTGPWVTQDRQSSWTFNTDTTWGYQMGVRGGFANIQNNCFKMDDYAAPAGQYVVSAGTAATYCAPVGNVFNSNQGSVSDSPTPLLQARLPGWRGRMPGAEVGGGATSRSPSPVHFRIANVGDFASVADPVLFPPDTLGSLSSWCSTEILGVRPTQNGELKDALMPVYFCRYTP